MSIQTLSRRGVALLFIALVAGCSSSGPKGSDSAYPSRSSSSASGPAKVSEECRASRSKCLYQGPYESGERDYAEAEAKRLNLAELERLRRGFGN